MTTCPLTTPHADDAHSRPQDPPGCAARAQVRAESLDPEALPAALKAAPYDASTGPELHDIQLHGGLIAVRCSPVRKVLITSGAPGSRPPTDPRWRGSPAMPVLGHARRRVAVFVSRPERHQLPPTGSSARTCGWSIGGPLGRPRERRATRWCVPCRRPPRTESVPPGVPGWCAGWGIITPRTPRLAGAAGRPSASTRTARRVRSCPGTLSETVSW